MMKFFKSYFPLSFQAADAKALAVTILLYLFAGGCASALLYFLSHLWLIGWIFHILGALISLYAIVGILLSILHFTGTIH